jgi:serine O-acetyltransferase
MRTPKNTAHCLLLVLEYLLANKGFRAVFCYRISHVNAGNIAYYICSFFNTVEISNKAQIGYGLLIPHAQCIVIAAGAEIGNMVTIQQGVTIGGNLDEVKNERTKPVIGDNVLVGAGAKILGPVIIGDNCIIGANAVVVQDIPANSIAVGIPAKVVKTVTESYPELLKRLDKSLR